jgi:hexosaminidase
MLDLIPRPVCAEARPGSFQINEKTILAADGASLPAARILRELLSAPTGFPLEIRTGEMPGGENGIFIRQDPALADLGAEGYRLDIQDRRVMLTAAGPAGIFYGIQSLRQLLPVEVESRSGVSGLTWKVACALIVDRPRFSWRGFMLDEARHFHGPDTVKRILELMALHKINVFHWHLTDDQGWRIEIRKYPRLTQLGAWRAGTRRTFLPGGGHDGVPHGGFYTQAELKEIVEFAAARHILVVPEIEIPGHSLAALAAYPELSCRGGPFEVATHFGVFPDILCAGKESTYAFLQDVLDKIVGIFPSPFIHIGGDEAPMARWKACPACQNSIRELGLMNEHALQVHLTNRLGEILQERGRRPVGWNEILDDNLTDSAVLQYWAGSRKRLGDAIRSGRQVIMSSYLDCYLDHSHWLMPLSRAYRYEPILPEWNEAQAGRVLGMEFPLWSEWVPDRARLDYQAFPRLTAMAEASWSQAASRDFPDFCRRLSGFLERLKKLGGATRPWRRQNRLLGCARQGGSRSSSPKRAPPDEKRTATRREAVLLADFPRRLPPGRTTAGGSGRPGAADGRPVRACRRSFHRRT